LCAVPAFAQYVPIAMQGKWIIKKDLTEKSQGCYDPVRKQTLVGLKLTLSVDRLIWNGVAGGDLQPRELMLSGYEFKFRFGLKPSDLGIYENPVPIIYVVPSVGIPVNAFIARDPHTILIDACNIWLVAVRDDATAEAVKP
jgi:hypothetical protein